MIALNGVFIVVAQPLLLPLLGRVGGAARLGRAERGALALWERAPAWA
jgi:hypothetical protein